MHVVAFINMVAGTAEYMLPVTDITCGVARRAYIASLLLYDVSLSLKNTTGYGSF